ncbi:hypothetical protein L1887_60359 [Cichorium endivia]|nr:hypothetical protein L1887_60359 [Cichorium endivia]
MSFLHEPGRQPRWTSRKSETECKKSTRQKVEAQNDRRWEEKAAKTAALDRLREEGGKPPRHCHFCMAQWQKNAHLESAPLDGFSSVVKPSK